MDKRYRFRIWTAGSSAVEHTIGSTEFHAAPGTVGGQTVDMLRGRTEAHPWEILVADVSNAFSQKVADSGGRLVLLRRLCDLQRSTDGGSSWQTQVTGRIDALSDQVSFWRVGISDERLLERKTEIFKTMGSVLGSGSTAIYAGTRIFPPGIDGTYGPFEIPIAHPDSDSEGTKINNGVRLRLDAVQKTITVLGQTITVDIADNLTITPEIVQFIKDDLKEDAEPVNMATTATSFRSLRCRVNGTEREIYGFGPLAPVLGAPIGSSLDDLLTGVQQNLYAWVEWSTFSTGTSITSAVLIASTHEPTDQAPLHIGGSSGYQPFSLVQDIYDELGVRYSTQALADLQADNRFPLMRWRITAPQNAANWLEDHIYGPLGVVPFINSNGEVAPRKIHLPTSTDLNGSSTTLFEFTESNVSLPHPSWDTQARDVVTRITYRYTGEELFTDFSAETKPAHPIDLVMERDLELPPYEHDRIDNLGVHEIEYKLNGLHTALGLPFPNSTLRFPAAITRLADFMAGEIFDRFGDGPIRNRFVVTSTGEDVVPGDFYRVTIPTFPTPNTQSRGGTRVVQALNLMHSVEGPEFEALDAGPSAQVLAAPTVTLAAATANPKHELIATVTSLSTAADGYVLQIARGSSEPSSTSNQWVFAAFGTSTGTASVKPVAGGSTFFARAITRANGRFRSTWSTAPTAQTSDLPNPSSVATSDIQGQSAFVVWTPGSTVYPTQVLLDQSSDCASASLSVIGVAAAGGNRFSLSPLTLDSTHCVGVRHADPWGGVSQTTSVSFQTTTSLPAAPAAGGMVLVQGSACG